MCAACITLFFIGFVKKRGAFPKMWRKSSIVCFKRSRRLHGSFSAWIAVLFWAVEDLLRFLRLYRHGDRRLRGCSGYELTVEFRFPVLFASSITEFWRRWHISLSTWLRDYLYISLGGNRGSKAFFVYRNLMLTMVLGGLWHGASWNFIIWGAMHGIALIVHRE